MTNEEYVMWLGILYDKVLSLRKDSDYIVNQPQMDKLVAVMNFFRDTASHFGGNVEPVQLVPKEEHGGVTATFVVFDVYGERVQQFCDVMRACSAITIDAKLNSEVCISCTIPNVFVPKEGLA